jgi:hypothetical protein
MTWEDWLPWSRWLAGPGAHWGAYAYDVELYTQGIPEQAMTPELARMWARNTARRIDAVGFRAGHYDIFEARRIASWSAIAQLQGYATLWPLQWPDLELGRLYLVSERIPDDVRALAARAGIWTWTPEDATPAPPAR